jgi:hypothetical protein
MKFSTYLGTDPLVTITTDKEGLLTLINAAQLAITQLNEWNFGDEYDTDITPYHEIQEQLKIKYNQLYGELTQPKL